MSSRLAPYQLQMDETTSLIAQAVMPPNPAVNADVPGTFDLVANHVGGTPVTLYRKAATHFPICASLC